MKDEYGNNYGQAESRDGDATTGSYYVLLPDGRTQTVNYNVDKYSGFQAQVSYEGEARFPAASSGPSSAAAPIYQPFKRSTPPAAAPITASIPHFHESVPNSPPHFIETPSSQSATPVVIETNYIDGPPPPPPPPQDFEYIPAPPNNYNPF